MSDESKAPPRWLRIATVVALNIFGTFFAARAFGFIPGVIGVVVADMLLRPRESRRRAYLAIGLSVVFAVGASAVFYQRINALRKWEGVESPAFALTTLDGKRIESAELRGKRVVLNFWATWCGPCQMEIPEINKLFVAAGDADVAVFGVSNESEEVIRKFLAEHQVDYPIAISRGQMPSPYRDVIAVPTTFVLDRKGIIQFVRAGYVGPDELRAAGWDAEDLQGAPNSAPLGEDPS